MNTWTTSFAILIGILGIWLLMRFARLSKAGPRFFSKWLFKHHALKILFGVSVVAVLLVGTVVKIYYSSPEPDPQLGRTILFEIGGTAGYITPEVNRFFWSCIVLCVVTLLTGTFWPTESKNQFLQKKESKCQALRRGRTEDSASSTSSTRCVTRVLDCSTRLDMPHGELAFYWQFQKRNRYAVIAGVWVMAILVWVDQASNINWWPRIIMLGIALWILRLFVDYRTCIDGKNKILKEEKLLFGFWRFRVNYTPLSEFVAVTLDSCDDPDDCISTIYICLKHRNGRLTRICYFEALNGHRSVDAENVAREIAVIIEPREPTIVPAVPTIFRTLE